MSHILQYKTSLLELKDILKHFKEKGLTKDYLEVVLKKLIPNLDGDLKIGWNISEKGYSAAKFVPKTRTLIFSLKKINEWLDNNTRDFLEKLQTSDPNILRSYFFLFLLTHEVEHSYQYLIGEGIIEVPSPTIKAAYQKLFGLMKPSNTIIPRPIKQTRRAISLLLYKTKENGLVLERNANIESTDLICRCAFYNEREDIYNLFIDMRNLFRTQGYIKSTKGSIEETFEEIFMHDKYKKIRQEIDLDEIDRLRYGLNISEETRKRILRKN